MTFDIAILRETALPARGNVSGVYFLFNDEELVYISQG
jgi:hypothetical protein